ncbi:MAG: hypothetical protein IPK80_14785 [Nannocystis sp.]|nr:hypothetical protein [Nannocystis sp.]
MALPPRPSAPQHLGTALVLGLACTPSGSDTTTGLSVPDTWAGGSTGGSTDAFTTDLSATANASSTASSATTSASTDDSSPTTDATTLIYDVGPDTTDSDTADTKPPGCKGKIDFLFVISRHGSMKSAQEQLIAAFPEVHRDDRGEVRRLRLPHHGHRWRPHLGPSDPRSEVRSERHL